MQEIVSPTPERRGVDNNDILAPSRHSIEVAIAIAAMRKWRCRDTSRLAPLRDLILEAAGQHSHRESKYRHREDRRERP